MRTFRKAGDMLSVLFPDRAEHSLILFFIFNGSGKVTLDL